jgi:hypothetical protein
LPDDSILISGGLEKYQTPMGIRQNLDAELYRTTNDATITKPAEK